MQRVRSVHPLPITESAIEQHPLAIELVERDGQQRA
jgi:hypothetical protein